MACTLIQGREIDCRDAAGGIEEVYITEFTNKLALTATSGNITAFTLSSGKKFWTYKLEKEIAELTEREMGSVENGTLFYEQELNFTLKKMSASLRNEIRNLAQNRLLIIIKDNNGTYWLLGQDRGADKIGTNEAKTGKAFGDMQGYTLTFLAKELTPANTVTASLITTLTVNAA